VLGAQRSAEQLVMGDLDHAGWPRHLDRMLIHWDADHWTDPTLLASRLRLPSAITGETHVVPELSRGPSDGGNAHGAATASGGPGGRQLILFTNRMCAGCQLTKKTIADSPALRKLLSKWDYQIVDTATSEGEELAARDRVTVVPVLVGFSGGHEIFRSDDLDTPEKIASVVGSH